MKIFQAWGLPVVAMTGFFAILLGMVPYATGYGWARIPLGPLLWAMWGIPDWEHAFLVPFISLIIVALRLPAILRETPRGSDWGLAWIALGLFVYWLGLRAEMQYFGFAATQILLAGLIVWFWGARVFRLLGFAWLFLFFAWPLPFLDSVVAFPLRMEMSQLSAHLLNLLGTPCLYSGTAVLSAPDAAAGIKMGEKFQIDIADPCSGLHSLFALMMMAALAGYIAVRSPVARLVVFLAAGPLAIAGNMVRILLLVWATERYGRSFLGTEAHPSLFHLACGFAVYLAALILLIGLIGLLNSRAMERAGQTVRNYFVARFGGRDDMPPGARIAD